MTSPAPPAESPAAILGHRLRQIRKNRGLTCRELAAQAGVAGADLARIEAGTHRVDVDTLVRLLAALRLAPNELSTSSS